jgi:hypothetical protein
MRGKKMESNYQKHKKRRIKELNQRAYENRNLCNNRFYRVKNQN